MSKKLSEIFKNILNEDDGSNIFNDYVPVYILNEPTNVKFKMSVSGDEELNGTIQSSQSDHEKISKGERLNVYTFELVIGEDKRVVQLSGKEVNSSKNAGAPTLFKNTPYTFISGDNLVKTDENDNFYNGFDIEEVNDILGSLKNDTEIFRTISKYKDDNDFQNVFLDSFISGT